MAEYIGFQPSDFFSTKLYTGTAAELAITGVGFQPDMTWIKSRSIVKNHYLYDTARGATKNLAVNDTDAEGTTAEGLKSWQSDGFTLGTSGGENTSSATYVSWNWKGGTTSGITTDGSTTITPSAYSFSATSGISIVKYSGNNTSGAKVAHGLGAVPEMIIVKTTNTANEWNIYHKGVAATSPEDYYMTFTTGARTDDSSRWNDTAPDAVNFTLGNAAAVNGSSNTMVAYCFAPKNGYSKFGKYWGNGQTETASTFIYTGFKPNFVMVKKSNLTQEWQMTDSVRDDTVSGIGNGGGARLLAQSNAAESTNSTWALINKYSNGFQLNHSDGVVNGSGDEYIYMAFAEFPIVSSNDVPTVAR